MPDLSIMIKPASSNCNMKCEYCFYCDEAQNRLTGNYGMLSESTAYKLIISALDHANGDSIAFAFQGGEPTLRGLEFFKHFVYMVNKNNHRGSVIYYSLQTNGLLIDDKWCDFFRENKFLIGLSLDGRREDNAFRIDRQGAETFDRIISAANLMSMRGVAFNILTVVTKNVSKKIEEIYDFYKSQGFKYLQFIPCIRDFDAGNSSNKSRVGVVANNETSAGNLGNKHSVEFIEGNKTTRDSSSNNAGNGSHKCDNKDTRIAYKATCEKEDMYMNSEDFYNFLSKLFSKYVKDYSEGKYTSIRMFDNYVALYKGQRAEQCGMEGHCTYQFVVEGNGNVYPCDFYCLDEYLLGNINDMTLKQMAASDKAKNFILESLERDIECANCLYFKVCRGGGCKRNKVSYNYCGAYKKFFDNYLHMFRVFYLV